MRVFIITGTRKGIGRQLAEYYLNLGNIVCGCARGESSINHKNYHHFILSVDDEKKVIEMVREVKKRFNQIDVLINNAGIASMNHILLTPKRSVDNIFNTNFVGSFLFCREVAKAMSAMYKRDNSLFFRIVNFSTVATPLRLEGECIYAASKASINSLTQIAAKELSQFNITVNAIGPTPVKTDLIKSVPRDKMDALLNSQAIKRFGDFEDVINAIEFFIKKESSFITGQVLYLGGVSG